MPATMSYRRKHSHPMRELNRDSGQLYVKFARANVFVLLPRCAGMCAQVYKMIEVISTNPTTIVPFA